MSADVVVIHTDLGWQFNTLTQKGADLFGGILCIISDQAEARKKILDCSYNDLTVETHGLLLLGWQPRLRKISKTRKRRHYVGGVIR
jgi:hypothetical protein